MEEPVQTQANIENSDASPPTFDFAQIYTAHHLQKPFDYKDTSGRLPLPQLKKLTQEELIAMAEKAGDDDDDDEPPVELRASPGELDLQTLTNTPMVYAYNMAEKRLEAEEKKEKEAEATEPQ